MLNGTIRVLVSCVAIAFFGYAATSAQTGWADRSSSYQPLQNLCANSDDEIVRYGLRSRYLEGDSQRAALNVYETCYSQQASGRKSTPPPVVNRVGAAEVGQPTYTRRYAGQTQASPVQSFQRQEVYYASEYYPESQQTRAPKVSYTDTYQSSGSVPYQRSSSEYSSVTTTTSPVVNQTRTVVTQQPTYTQRYVEPTEISTFDGLERQDVSYGSGYTSSANQVRSPAVSQTESYQSSQSVPYRRDDFEYSVTKATTAAIVNQARATENARQNSARAYVSPTEVSAFDGLERQDVAYRSEHLSEPRQVQPSVVIPDAAAYRNAEPAPYEPDSFEYSVARVPPEQHPFQLSRTEYSSLRPGDRVLITYIRTAKPVVPVYLVQPGDTLSVSVDGAPEISVTATRVLPDGTIYIPEIGVTRVAGSNVADIVSFLESELVRLRIRNPKVNLTINETDDQAARFLEALTSGGEFTGPTLAITVSRGQNVSIPFVGEFDPRAPLSVWRETISRAVYEQFNGALEVIVNVERNTPDTVYVIGEVTRPGDIDIASADNAFSAIAAAGGFLKTAARNRLLVVRTNKIGGREIIPLNLKQLVLGRVEQPALDLLPDDILIVPPTRIAQSNTAIEQYVRNMLPFDVSFQF